MKKILPILSIIFCLSANAQDTTVSITLQARDIEFLAPKILFNQRFETLGDSIRSIFRRDTSIVNTTQITITKIPYTEIINLLTDIKYSTNIDIPDNVYTRIKNAISAITETKIVAAVTEMDNRTNINFISQRRAGRKFLLKQKQ